MQVGYAQGFAATLDHYSEEPFVDLSTAIQTNLAAVGIKASLVSGGDLYHKMRQLAWGRSPIVFMLQQNDVAVARKNLVGFHLGPQSDFDRCAGMRKS